MPADQFVVRWMLFRLMRRVTKRTLADGHVTVNRNIKTVKGTSIFG
jgi:hypothetical protein